MNEGSVKCERIRYRGKNHRFSLHGLNSKVVRASLPGTKPPSLCYCLSSVMEKTLKDRDAFTHLDAAKIRSA